MRFQTSIASRLVFAVLFGAGVGVAAAQSHPAVAVQPVAHLDVDTGVIAKPASPRMYGLMTEEINHSYEGGLYAELVRNNTFRSDWSGIEGWGEVVKGRAQATVEIDKADGPSVALPASLKVKVDAASAGNEAGVSNSGYWGIAVRPRTTYRGSFYAKTDGAVGPLTARLISDQTGAVLASASVALTEGGWSRYEFVLTTGAVAASAANHLELVVARPGRCICSWCR